MWEDTGRALATTEDSEVMSSVFLQGIRIFFSLAMWQEFRFFELKTFFRQIPVFLDTPFLFYLPAFCYYSSQHKEDFAFRHAYLEIKR